MAINKAVSTNVMKRTVSVCTRQHLDVWRVASRYMIQNIDAEEYSVIVPDIDVPEFMRETPALIQVIAESHYAKQFDGLLKSVFPAGHRQRYGWYLQQFLKLSALEDNKDGVSLIWDADTVPLRKLQFFDGVNLGYYGGREFHLPYFQQIQSVTGLNKAVDFSFIAQCFPIKAEWFREFTHFIQERNERPWLEALIASINFAMVSGFSEYELLGTFLVNKHADHMYRIPRDWQRYGNSLIGGVGNLEDPKHKDALSRYDYISFEAWDKPG